jgi:hypothetical protein
MLQIVVHRASSPEADALAGPSGTQKKIRLNWKKARVIGREAGHVAVDRMNRGDVEGPSERLRSACAPHCHSRQ